jgi:Xaa-Pro aminopeptidase
VQASQIVHSVFGSFQPQTGSFAVQFNRFNRPIRTDQFNDLRLECIFRRRADLEMLEQRATAEASNRVTVQSMLESIRAGLSNLDVQALWVAKPANVRYLTGFTSPSDAKLLITESAAVLYTDARYTVQAQNECRVPHVIARWEEVFAHVKPLVTGKNVGFEADAVLYSDFNELLQGLGVTLLPVMGMVEALRAVKSDDEVQKMRHAAQIADVAFEQILPLVVPGASERDIALQLEFQMRRLGAERAAFEIIVASGERGAMPHGTAGHKLIADGELVTIDWGAALDGYHSDCTRTVAVGRVSDKLIEIYRTVLEAHRLGMAAVRPAAKCFAVDAISRDAIDGAGYGEFFGHSLGHGVGLDVHEMPKLSFRARDEERLEVGNVVTVEPGIYVPGVGGVRIEDMVLVTSDGCESLTHAPKQLL